MKPTTPLTVLALASPALSAFLGLEFAYSILARHIDHHHPTHPGLEIDTTLTAADSHIWANKDGAAACPPEANVSCAAALNTTTFVFSRKTNTARLNVAHPGGQQLYVDAEGAVRYTPVDNSVLLASVQTRHLKRRLHDGLRTWMCSEGKEEDGEEQAFKLYLTDKPAMRPMVEDEGKICVRTDLHFQRLKKGPTAWQFD